MSTPDADSTSLYYRPRILEEETEWANFPRTIHIPPNNSPKYLNTRYEYFSRLKNDTQTRSQSRLTFPEAGPFQGETVSRYLASNIPVRDKPSNMLERLRVYLGAG